MDIKTKLVKSPLHDWNMANNALSMWDDNFPWVYQYDYEDYMNEYEAVRNGTGLMDGFSFFVFEVKGKDAGKFIQRTFTNIVETMEVGQVRYAPFVNEKGIMMDEGSVFKFSDERFLVIVNGPNLQWQMKEYAGDLDAVITDITEKRTTIAVQGPTSIEMLNPLVDRDLNELKYFRFFDNMTVAGCPCWISRMGYSGEKGFEVNLAYKDAPKVWEALIERGCVPFGVFAIEVLRVEAGLALIYIDFRLNDMSPWDLSMDHCIKLHPDCVGTEALKEYQKVLPWRFKTLKIEGSELPVFHTGIYVNKEPVGLVKSMANSPICGCIALSMIETPFAKDGTKVEVMIDGKFVSAEVAPISVFDPEKKRMRG